MRCSGGESLGVLRRGVCLSLASSPAGRRKHTQEGNGVAKKFFVLENPRARRRGLSWRGLRVSKEGKGKVSLEIWKGDGNIRKFVEGGNLRPSGGEKVILF